MKDERPWMTFASIAFLDGALRPDMRVFEWGSGGSTLFFSKRAKEVIAVEDDAEWAENVRRVCAERGYKNVTLEYVPQDGDAPLTKFDPADPDAFVSNSTLHH